MEENELAGAVPQKVVGGVLGAQQGPTLSQVGQGALPQTSKGMPAFTSPKLAPEVSEPEGDRSSAKGSSDLLQQFFVFWWRPARFVRAAGGLRARTPTDLLLASKSCARAC